MNPNTSPVLNLSADARHVTYICKAMPRGGGLSVCLPWKVCRDFDFSAEDTEFVLKVNPDGSLLMTPQARAKPWALTPEVATSD